MFQVNKVESKDVRTRLFHHSCFLLISQVCRPLCEENLNTIFVTEPMKYANKYTDFLVRSLCFIESER